MVHDPAKKSSKRRLQTPDRRYLLLGDKLLRSYNPNLPNDRIDDLLVVLFNSRCDLRRARQCDGTEPLELVDAIEAARRALGQSGPVWWDDGAPDLDGVPVLSTCYAEWFKSMLKREE